MVCSVVVGATPVVRAAAPLAARRAAVFAAALAPLAARLICRALLATKPGAPGVASANTGAAAPIPAPRAAPAADFFRAFPKPLLASLGVKLLRTPDAISFLRNSLKAFTLVTGIPAFLYSAISLLSWLFIFLEFPTFTL